MYEYAQTKSHDLDELTLLCDRHHAEKTKGLLPKTTVIEANQNPINRKNGISEPYGLHFSGNRCEVNIGGNWFHSTSARLVPFIINNLEIFTFDFRDGELLVSCQIQDQQGNSTLVIDENELIYAVDSWDIEFVGKTLTLRNSPREFQFQVTFQPPSQITVSRLDMQYRDVRVFVDPNGFHVRGPGVRTRDLANASMAGGFEYAIALDSKVLTAVGLIL
ncbi:hypothetical protein ACIHIX_09455 [Streptomyces sp. NPDC051913]|uniref:hypothetical protein n=1 Tax=Streptomyces sp. NPDC051913 TaxID=3365676 RepID=UPI0037D26E9D